MLVLRDASPSTVFDLVGRDENSATYALGWTLAQCPAFAQRFLQRLAGQDVPTDLMQVRLQRSGDDRGYTDVEIRCGEVFEAIIEAKVGDNLPGVRQFERYLPRLMASKSRIRKMVSVSALPADVATLSLPTGLGVPVEHLSWGEIRGIAERSRQESREFEQRLWLDHLARHLEYYAAMNRAHSNLVYVVSLGSQPMREGGTHTWIDVVEKDGCYFHPIRNHWPKEPPNYIGFRYRGALQSVHRVEAYRIVDDLEAANPHWPTDKGPHFIYTLGPAMRPPRPLRAGVPGDSIQRSMRVTCEIDTLLSGQFDLLGQAHAESGRRWQAAKDSSAGR